MSIKISIIMPVHNAEKLVWETIESILNQTYKDFEFVIVDDCSTDNSYEICQKYTQQDKRIKLYKNEKNLWVVKTRNKLLKLVDKKSQYIAIIDSDDVAKPERLAKQIEFLEKNLDYAVVGSFLEIIDENSKTIWYRKYPISYKDVKKTICKKSPLAQPAVMIRKSAWNNVWAYNENFERVQDYELWFRFFNKWYKLGNLPEYLLKYRIHSNQWKSKHLKLTLKNTIKIQLSNIKKCFCSLGYILAEIFLLALPSKWILEMFKKLEYKNEK